MTNRVRSLVVAASLLAIPAVASAQEQIFKLGYTDIGAVIGLGGTGDAGVAIGGRFERAIKALPDYGNGTLGIGVSADVYSWSYRAGGYSSSVRYIPIGVTGNYHFNLTNKKLVPFLGAGLGYEVVTCSYKGPGIDIGCGAYNSGIYIIGRAGARYFVQDNLAVYGDVGAGGATLNVGATFKLR